jgi:hypothetical protein
VNCINVEISKELKKKYRHRIKQCYRNSINLLTKNEVEYTEIGYLKENGTYIRHSWGVKENQIIDTTLNKWGNKDIKNLEYYPIFKINDIGEIIYKTSGPAALELDPEKEYLFLKQELGTIERIISCAEVAHNNILIEYAINQRSLKQGV